MIMYTEELNIVYNNTNLIRNLSNPVIFLVLKQSIMRRHIIVLKFYTSTLLISLYLCYRIILHVEHVAV